MIAEALEAAWVVASALAAWIVAGVVAVTVGLYAVVVAGWGIWRVVAAAYVAVAVRAGLYARLRAEVPEDAPRLPQPRERPATPRQRLPARPESPAAGPSSPHSPRQSAPQAPGGPFPAPNPERPSEARIRPRPSWARTDKEAA